MKTYLEAVLFWKMSGTKSDALKVCCKSSGTKLDALQLWRYSSGTKSDPAQAAGMASAAHRAPGRRPREERQIWRERGQLCPIGEEYPARRHRGRAHRLRPKRTGGCAQGAGRGAAHKRQARATRLAVGADAGAQRVEALRHGGALPGLLRRTPASRLGTRGKDPPVSSWGSIGPPARW